MSNLEINTILQASIETAKKGNFNSPDVSDGLKWKLHRTIGRIPIPIMRRIGLAPLNYIIRYYPNFVRKFVETGYVYPQGQAVFIRGQINLLKSNSPLGDLDLCKQIADWLIDSRNKDFKNHCWGQPFMWYSRMPFPPNLPRTTVSSQVGWAFLDLFEYTQDQKYLDVAISVCDFYLEDLNRTEDEHGNFCFSYTVLDNYHIHNASLLAASVLMRVSKITDIEKYRTAALQATQFSVHHQNDDGSWYYWAPPDKLLRKIDNYHTGFNLESLHTIIEDHPDDSFQSAYKSGLEYYYDNLFDGPIPKNTNTRTYPIDIQGCAQSIITFMLAGVHDRKYIDKAQEINRYTLKNFFLESKQHFAYRIYENQFQDESYYFRWGDSWMIRALSLME